MEVFMFPDLSVSSILYECVVTLFGASSVLVAALSFNVCWHEVKNSFHDFRQSWKNVIKSRRNDAHRMPEIHSGEREEMNLTSEKPREGSLYSKYRAKFPSEPNSINELNKRSADYDADLKTKNPF